MYKKIYYAAPLFNNLEKDSNASNAEVLRSQGYGYEVYLPQEAGEAITGKVSRLDLYNTDIEHLNWADVIVADISGRVPDEGTSFEIGYAIAQGKPVILLDNNEARSFMQGHMNVMLEGSAWSGRNAHSAGEVLVMLSELNHTLGGRS